MLELTYKHFELEGVEEIAYLPYRVPMDLLDDRYSVGRKRLAAQSDKATNLFKSLEYMYLKGILLSKYAEGSKYHSFDTLMAVLDSPYPMRLSGYVALHNHDGVLFRLEGELFMICHGDGSYWLWHLDGVSLEAYNREQRRPIFKDVELKPLNQ